MINEKQARKYCREDITLIKNYAEAVADTTQTWICHHQNAEPFTGFCTKDLKKMNMYYQRPASELKFVTYSEHTYIHGKGKRGTMYGKRQSEETRKKISAAMKGKTHSEETRKKLKGKAAWNKGKILSEETRKKMSETHNGKHWYNNGIVDTFAKSCPEGFVPGRIRRGIVI